MKKRAATHAGHLGLSGLVVPLSLVLATFIANEGQMLLGLDLDRVSLSLYLAPFLVAAAAAIIALIKLEVSKIGGELGGIAETFLGSILAAAEATDKAPDIDLSEKSPNPPQGQPFPPPDKGWEAHMDPPDERQSP